MLGKGWGKTVLRQADVEPSCTSAAKGNSPKRQIAIYSKVTLLSAPCDSRLVCRAAEDEFGGEKGLTSDDRGSGDDRRGRGR